MAAIVIGTLGTLTLTLTLVALVIEAIKRRFLRRSS